MITSKFLIISSFILDWNLYLQYFCWSLLFVLWFYQNNRNSMHASFQVHFNNDGSMIVSGSHDGLWYTTSIKPAWFVILFILFFYCYVFTVIIVSIIMCRFSIPTILFCIYSLQRMVLYLPQTSLISFWKSILFIQ